jgi:hypothetical protein
MMPSTSAKEQKTGVKAEPFSERLNELKNCEFAGEVVIGESELDELAQIVGRELGRAVQTTASLGRLVLLAVNCAYYRTGSEGFWSPFLALLAFDNSPANQAWLGPKLERALINLGFQERPYVDGFRYVTPIRLQAGLTRHDFPAFARLLKSGRERYGWSRMRTMPHSDFVAFVQETIPRTKFREFLEEEPGGGALTRNVVEDLVRWQHGISRGAQPSPHGYRPGFWEELLPLLDSSTPKQRTLRASAPVPKFTFDLVRSQLGLLFPQDFVNRREVRLDGQTVYEGFLALTRLAALRNEYPIELRVGGEGWTPMLVRGWFPSPDDPFALFGFGGEYLPRGSSVAPASGALRDTRTSAAWLQMMSLQFFEYGVCSLVCLFISTFTRKTCTVACR